MRYRVELNQNHARLEDCNANRHAFERPRLRAREFFVRSACSECVYVEGPTMPGGAGKRLVAGAHENPQLLRGRTGAPRSLLKHRAGTVFSSPQGRSGFCRRCGRRRRLAHRRGLVIPKPQSSYFRARQVSLGMAGREPCQHPSPPRICRTYRRPRGLKPDERLRSHPESLCLPGQERLDSPSIQADEGSGSVQLQSRQFYERIRAVAYLMRWNWPRDELIFGSRSTLPFASISPSRSL